MSQYDQRTSMINGQTPNHIQSGASLLESEKSIKKNKKKNNQSRIEFIDKISKMAATNEKIAQPR